MRYCHKGTNRSSGTYYNGRRSVYSWGLLANHADHRVTNWSWVLITRPWLCHLEKLVAEAERTRTGVATGRCRREVLMRSLLHGNNLLAGRAPTKSPFSFRLVYGLWAPATSIGVALQVSSCCSKPRLELNEPAGRRQHILAKRAGCEVPRARWTQIGREALDAIFSIDSEDYSLVGMVDHFTGS